MKSAVDAPKQRHWTKRIFITVVTMSNDANWLIGTCSPIDRVHLIDRKRERDAIHLVLDYWLTHSHRLETSNILIRTTRENNMNFYVHHSDAGQAFSKQLHSFEYFIATSQRELNSLSRLNFVNKVSLNSIDLSLHSLGPIDCLVFDVSDDEHRNAEE